jgi:hypothetical protein
MEIYRYVTWTTGPITVLRVSITSVFAFIMKPVIIIIRMFAAKIQNK